MGQLLNVEDNVSSVPVVNTQNVPVASSSASASKLGDSPAITALKLGTVGINYSLSAVYAFS